MAKDSLMASLFGISPETFRQNRQEETRKQALEFAKLDPYERANEMAFIAGRGLGDIVGGALGAEDPQLQRITAQNQILSSLDFTNPQSIATGISRAQQAGIPELAYRLLGARDEATERQQKQLVAQRQLLAQKIAMGAYDPGQAAIPAQEDLQETDALRYGRAAVAPSFDISRVEPQLMALGAQGREELNALRTSQKAMLPETKELKKGEKLLQRQPDGNWKFVTPEGQPVQTVSSDNAIQSLIAGNAIHPTVLPYAKQLTRNFINLDPEDQDKVMKDLTTINNTAIERESNKSYKDSAQASLLATQQLSRQLTQLNINKAIEDSIKAKDGKEIKLPDATKLANQSEGVNKLVDIYESFKPEYSGYVSDAVGNVAVLAASKMSDPNSVNLYQWWQGYQDHVNKVRNELFGAALTAPEKAEFEKAMVTKGTNPSQAEANLRRQAEIALKAYNKLEGVLRVQGYSKSALDLLKPTGLRPPLNSPDLQK